jgi:hypothetical protein
MSSITPIPPRWRPNPDPSSIHVPGLDTNASVIDQIEQMEQLITIKLQVSKYTSRDICVALTFLVRT